MTEPFASAHQKLAWGRKHIAELERELAAFYKVSPGKVVSEPHPDKPGYKVYKLRMTRPLPPPIDRGMGGYAQSEACERALRNAL